MLYLHPNTCIDATKTGRKDGRKEGRGEGGEMGDG